MGGRTDTAAAAAAAAAAYLLKGTLPQLKLLTGRVSAIEAQHAASLCRYLRVSKEECRGDQGQSVRGFEQGEAALDEFNRGADLLDFEDEARLAAFDACLSA